MIQLTPKQIHQMDALIAAEAFDLERAAGPFDGIALFNNMILGRLQAMGFAECKVVRPGTLRGNGQRCGSQQTVYWLTAAGRARAAER